MRGGAFVERDRGGRLTWEVDRPARGGGRRGGSLFGKGKSSLCVVSRRVADGGPVLFNCGLGRRGLGGCGS